MVTTKVRTGAIIGVGTNVHVLKMDESAFSRRPDDEAARVRSMEGERFEVYDVDERGGAQVEKWRHPADDEALSHSLNLAPSKIEVIGDDR